MLLQSDIRQGFKRYQTFHFKALHQFLYKTPLSYHFVEKNHVWKKDTHHLTLTHIQITYGSKLAFGGDTSLRKSKNAFSRFYGDLVYKFKKIIGNPNFSNLLKRIVNRFKRAGYSLDIMRQTACLVFNPIMVEGYAALFSCTAVVQVSDSMTASM